MFDLSSEFKNLNVKYEAGMQELEEAKARFERERAHSEQTIDDFKNSQKVESPVPVQDQFEKDRIIDKLRHQLKYGVAAGEISATFDHSYPGVGGTIKSGSL